MVLVTSKILVYNYIRHNLEEFYLYNKHFIIYDILYTCVMRIGGLHDLCYLQ